MSSRRMLAANILALSALQMLNYIVPLITVPYLVRKLGPVHFGLISFAQGTILYLDFFTDYGFNLSATRAISVHRDSVRTVSRIFWATLGAKALLMALSAIVLFALLALVPKLQAISLLLAVNFLYVIGTASYPIWLFQGLEQLQLSAVLFGVARLLTIPALLFWVNSPRDYIIAAGIQASVELVASILAVPFLLRSAHLQWLCPSVDDILASLRQGWTTFVSGLVLFLSSSSAIVILGFVADGKQLGYFSGADKLIKAFISVLNPVTQALYPHLADLRQRSPERTLQVIRTSAVILSGVGLTISLSIAAFAPAISGTILGRPFAASTSVLEWLAPLPFLYGLINVLGTQTMLLFELDRLLARIMLLGAVIELPAAIALSRWFGANGAAAASTLFAATVVAVMIVALERRNLLAGRSFVWQPAGRVPPSLKTE